jgi:pimeloyl-ACP methyl ester carboxylesterase
MSEGSADALNPEIVRQCLRKEPNMSNSRPGGFLVFTRPCVAIAVVSLLLGISVSASPAGDQRVVPFGITPPSPLPGCDVSASGSAYHVVCVPAAWNGSLVVYAHGYVSPDEPNPPFFPAETAQVAQAVMPFGFAFAATSYPDLGLVVPAAVTDLVSLVKEFKSAHAQTQNVYLVGFSEGGLITTKAVEQYPAVFSGGLACCGPVGDFRKQLNYFGDFFVAFNYFFPNVFEGKADPGRVEPGVIAGWEDIYVPRIRAAIADTWRTSQLLRVTQASIDPGNPATVEQTVLDVLWYDIFATEDAIEKLGGQPFDNSSRWYTGSSNDWALNRGVQRFRADAAALQSIRDSYQTTGRLKRPLVTMHTTADPIVPYWHEPLYGWKVLLSGSLLLHTNVPIIRYGHCTFETNELLGGFALLILKVAGQNLLSR